MGLLSPLTIAAAEHRHADQVLLGSAFRRIYRALTAEESGRAEDDWTEAATEGYLAGIARAKAIVAEVIKGMEVDLTPVLPADWHTPRFAEDPDSDRLSKYVGTAPAHQWKGADLDKVSKP